MAPVRTARNATRRRSALPALIGDPAQVLRAERMRYRCGIDFPDSLWVWSGGGTQTLQDELCGALRGRLLRWPVRLAYPLCPDTRFHSEGFGVLRPVGAYDRISGLWQTEALRQMLQGALVIVHAGHGDVQSFGPADDVALDDVARSREAAVQ